MKQLNNVFDFKSLFSSNLKLKLSGISGAFMLPIATMAITGLFLSLGGQMSSWGSNIVWLKSIGLGIQSISFPILQAFPLLLCISFAISFTKQETGIAVWCAILSFFTFIYFQSYFIDLGDCNGAGGAGCCQGGSCGCNSGGTNHCCAMLCCLSKSNFKILFIPDAGRNLVPSLITRMFGVNTLNTSIFGPMIIGGIIIPYIFKKYPEVKLPTYLSYFSGKRLLPLISTCFVTPLAIVFLLLWPWIGTGLSYLGNYISQSQGADAFLFGLFEKLLIPTGLHHIFASLFWYSPLGGDVPLALKNGSDNNCHKLLCCVNAVVHQGQCCKAPYLNSLSLQGDALIGLSAIALPTDQISSQKIFEFLEKKNIFAGRLTQGKFPIMQFALPAAALAIYLSSSKEKRREMSKTTFPGIWNSLILGITEPIEFSFMYSVPKLFYLFHSTMCGLSFLAMRLLKAHIPTAFSGGIIELLINGVLPFQKETKFYYWAAVGAILAIIYFITFYFTFKKINSKQSSELENSSIESADTTSNDGLPPEISSWKVGLGGWDNVTNYKNCASRLRYDIKDKSKVIESELKKAGVIAVKWVGDNHVQLIVGPKAEEINSKLLKYANPKS